jgi:hypothetical protein
MRTAAVSKVKDLASAVPDDKEGIRAVGRRISQLPEVTNSDLVAALTAVRQDSGKLAIAFALGERVEPLDTVVEVLLARVSDETPRVGVAYLTVLVRRGLLSDRRVLEAVVDYVSEKDGPETSWLQTAVVEHGRRGTQDFLPRLLAMARKGDAQDLRWTARIAAAIGVPAREVVETLTDRVKTLPPSQAMYVQDEVAAARKSVGLE